MSNEIYLIGIVITGIISATIGGLAGAAITLGRVTALVNTLRQDKPWEQAIQSLYNSVPVTAQATIKQGAGLLNSVDGLVQDIINPATQSGSGISPQSQANTLSFASAPSLPTTIADMPPQMAGQIAKTLIQGQTPAAPPDQAAA